MSRIVSILIVGILTFMSRIVGILTFMSTIGGILTFMNRKNSILSLSVPKNADFLDIFSSPGRSPGRAIVLPPALALVAASALAKNFNVKVFYVMGKALLGELSCPCDSSCYTYKH